MADGSSVSVPYDVVQSVSRGGDRGKVGKGTAGSRLKALHRVAGERLSLKAFAQSVEGKNPDAAEWLSNKGPSLKNKAKAARLKNKGARIAAEKLATKQAKQKGKR